MKAGVMKRAARALPSAEIAGVALWRRVADHLERAIADGRYPVDTRLPGEIEIAQGLGVNRHTVRRAIAALADRGFVRAERGSGPYVETRRLRYPIHPRTRFSEHVGAAGREPRGRLLASVVEEAEPDVARRLAVAPRTAVIRLDILAASIACPSPPQPRGCRPIAPPMPAASTATRARSRARWRDWGSTTFTARARGFRRPSPTPQMPRGCALRRAGR